MYLQSIFGPRFFFPMRKNTNIHRYYHTKAEIIKINKEFENVRTRKIHLRKNIMKLKYLKYLIINII